jgi:hypothetical protein
MAEIKAKIPQDDFVSKVVRDPKQPPDTLLLTGYLGESSEEGHTRLHFDPELKSYVEIPNDAILHTQPFPKESSPLGGHHVWIKRDADLIHGQVGPERTKAKFFEGPIAAGAAGGAAIPHAVTVLPGCGVTQATVCICPATPFHGCPPPTPLCPTLPVHCPTVLCHTPPHGCPPTPLCPTLPVHCPTVFCHTPLHGCPTPPVLCPTPTAIHQCATHVACPSVAVVCPTPTVLPHCPTHVACPSLAVVCPTPTVVQCVTQLCPSVHVPCQSIPACPSAIGCPSGPACGGIPGGPGDPVAVAHAAAAAHIAPTQTVLQCAPPTPLHGCPTPLQFCPTGVHACQPTPLHGCPPPPTPLCQSVHAPCVTLPAGCHTPLHGCPPPPTPLCQSVHAPCLTLPAVCHTTLVCHTPPLLCPTPTAVQLCPTQLCPSVHIPCQTVPACPSAIGCPSGPVCGGPIGGGGEPQV